VRVQTRQGTEVVLAQGGRVAYDRAEALVESVDETSGVVTLLVDRGEHTERVETTAARLNSKDDPGFIEDPGPTGDARDPQRPNRAARRRAKRG
jgi:hypothetical protein